MIGVMAELSSRTPTPVSNLLGAVVPHLAERLTEARIRREWRRLMGAEIARRCQPGELRSGTLQVVVTNSPWLQELTLREAELLSRLADSYGAGTVRTLRFSLGTLPSEPIAPARSHARSDDRPTTEETRMIEAAVTLIPDPDLQVRARGLLEKACLATRTRERIP